MQLEIVQELFSASKKKSEKKDKISPTKNGENLEETVENTPIRPKELDNLISDAIVFGDEEEKENIQDLLKELSKHYDPETEENNDEIPTVGGIFNDRSIILESHQKDLRKLVGKFCNSSCWGGLMETDESVLKDSISADITASKAFDPQSAQSIIAFSGGIDGNQALFDFIE